MDIESDDSERWEDFFGSSTELAPSLLGFYDTLTSALDVGLHSNSSNSSSSSSNSNSNSNISNDSSSHNGTNSTTSSTSDASSRKSSLEDQKHCGEYILNHSSTDEDVEADVNLNVEYKELQPQQHSTPNTSSSWCNRANSDNNNNGNNNNNDLTYFNSSTSSCQSLSTLSPTKQNNNNYSSSCNNSKSKSRESLASTTSIASSSTNKATTTTTNNSTKHRNNIRVLSQNVQRIITHSDVEPVDAVDIDALQNHSKSPVLSHRFAKKPTAPANAQHKVKFSHIPLSKITGKLTQTGTELVDTFDSSSEYLDALNFAKNERISRASNCSGSGYKKPPTPAIVPLPTCVTGVDEDEKTPTNATSPFTFDSALNTGSKTRKLTLPKPETQEIEKLNGVEMEEVSTTTQLFATSSNGNASSTANGRVHKEFIAAQPLSPCDLADAVNFSLVTQSIKQLTLNDHDTKISKSATSSSTELIEAINKPLISKPLVRSSSAACASTVAGSPLLTYARAKSLAAKANTLGGPMPIKLPTAEELAELEEANQISAESLDRLTDIKSRFSPKESHKGFMLPDIAKLKLRPLSSSSICSTSSSSSSGSDHLNGKLATSYLASVESLADQSENELKDSHIGMSVLERATREIIDSERSYVDDLHQVIRGYLLDWKERACLRLDELRILFANIEEIYDFNSTLLKQLENAGMDPQRIAKCFIDLREHFDVYTTYCTSYPEAISLLTKLLQATHTNALLTSTQKLLQQTLPLGSYLLKPVQRILKYHLLLDNLRKHCDVKEVFQAYEIMRQVARNIDQVKRKLEQQSRVKELSGILDGWLGPELTVLGELRQEGILLEHNKPRMVFLFGTMLIITKPKEDNRLQFKSYIHQNNLMLSEHLPGDPTSFYVIPYDEPRNQIKLTAKNRDQKRLWAQHIKGVILEKFDNIPKRAKELVYKLGDEDDRTPDKNTWKWSLHSTSPTPVYLERRNQYRRSEMRNRAKFKRKTVANSSSFESFNEMAENNNKETTPKPSKLLTRNNSLDDTMIPALQRLAAAVKNRGRHESIAAINVSAPSGNTNLSTTTDNATEVDAKSETVDKESGNDSACNCEPNANMTSALSSSTNCILRDQRKSALKSPIFSGKTLKERSKSVPRISLQVDDLEDERSSLHGSNTNLDARKSKSSKSVEVKQYNHKTIPKRIANIKKQRMSKKETSKFYMDLSEFEDTAQTVLKITESSENLLDKPLMITDLDEDDPEPNGNLPDVVENSADHGECKDNNETLSPAEKAKKDAQIILDLLKNNKEFERIYKKPPKKRSIENGPSVPTSPEPQEQASAPPEPPPRPPSHSPPPLDTEVESKAVECNEPIYESLLRNVHVPYKFSSPVFSRSKSMQHCKQREKKSPTATRPDSDYVTLIYSPEGVLKKVGDDLVEREPQLRRHDSEYYNQQQRGSNSSTSSSSSSTMTLKRESQQTVIHLDCSSSNISQLSSSTNEAIYARPIPKNLMKRLLTSSVGSKSSLENVCSSETSLVPRAARKSIDNLALVFGRSNKPPERRVSDVSEMCRQSILHRQGSEAVGERMAHGDYADPRTLFSVGVSEASLQRDSAFSLTSSNDSVCDNKRVNGAIGELATNFEYEDDVEASLETDFRDSAIYSDDNEKRPEHEVGDYIKRPTSPPPPPPVSSARQQKLKPNQHPQVPPKPKVAPALIRSSVITREHKLSEGRGNTEVILCPPNLSPAATRSWVLQQIENFNQQ